MTTFYVCRHGQTENNKLHRLSGWVDTPLTDQGRQDALSSAKKLRTLHFDYVITSDLGRAFITAYHITQTIHFEGVIDTDPGLREINYGDLANQPYASYPAHTPEQNTDFIVPGGESLAQMQQRVMSAVIDIAAKNHGKTILLVAHDGTLNALRAAFTQEAIGLVDTRSLNAHNTVIQFEFDGSSVVNLVDL